MLKAVGIFFCFVFSAVNYAESGSDFLKKVRANYEDLSSLQLTMRYELFKEQNSTKVHEQYESFYGRNGNETYRKIHTSEIINNKDYSLQINHDEKIIVVSSASKNDFFTSDIKTSLSFCKETLVTTSGDFHIITMILKSKIDLPYSKFVVVVDKKYFIQEMIFFYSIEMDFSKSYLTKDLHRPKLVVKYTDLSKRWKDDDGLLKTDRYLRIDNSKIFPADAYADYSILNLTNTKIHD